MVSTMKIRILLIALCALLFLPSCKKNNWMDWQAENEVWLVRNAKQDSIVLTPTGLQYKVIRQGVASIKPDNAKTVVINYKGWLITGDVFDQAENATSAVSDLIQGFAEGLKKMNKSGHYILYIPSNLGYGSAGSGTQGYANYIPPYSTLIFDVTLIDVY